MTQKIHLSRLDAETTYCGFSRLHNTDRRKVTTERMMADIEKVTCKSCLKFHNKELGITPYLLYPDQDLCDWSKITCEENCGNLGNGIDDNHPIPKSGCIITTTANPLVRIFRVGMNDLVIVPLFI